ncbi:FKBP-type peptidyl-prolyl cis-trans isomerase [Gemmatimonas sp.]|uniref:FKBP-type peptidyl-prolyl cis-trans isomerase n=2 Tax=Gemmatimonas sp. TaxID=1962908 RepID=UPI003565308C
MKQLLLAAMVLGVVGCARAPRFMLPIPPVEGKARPLFLLEAIDMAVGTGTALTSGRCVYAHYTGWTTDGKKFDSSRDTTNAGRTKDPISFPQGFRRVIAGWDLGFQGMNVGGSRRLIIPWQLAYGEKGRLPTIPEKATLIFDVELMQVADTMPRAEGAPRPAGQAPSCPAWNAVKPVPSSTLRE